ncbi:Na+/H+ antiporter NhaC family protein [Sediminitomix flava]|nr:Na+/H+ antiporter NhaC family protein [Sediminitomix flava]
MKALLKISPILVLAGFILSGFDILIAAPLATIYAAFVAAFTEKLNTQTIINAAVDNVKEMQIVFFILMCAYVMAEAFMATGVGASIINISLDLGITGRSVAVVGLVVTSLLSIATGTSWGTFAACAPVFLWLSHILGGDVILTIAAIAGGSCFGDNIGLISDTTVVSSGIQKVEVIDRIRHQGVWSALVLLFGVIAFYIAGFTMDLPSQPGDAHSAISSIPDEAWVSLQEKRASAVTLLEQVKEGMPYYMSLPLIIVLVAAFRGMSTLLCLFLGIISSLCFGLLQGTVSDVNSFLELMYNGFSSAGSWVIVMMMWIGAFGGIMLKMNAFEPIAKLVIKASRSVRQLMFYNGTLSILGNAALADEMAQIVTIGPILKDIVDKNVEGDEQSLYKLRLRNATFNDALGVFGSQLIPWHVYIGFYIGIASAVYPLYEFTALDIIKYNFMAMIAVMSILLLTLTGFDRFIPLFKLPSEPSVRLKNKK